MSGRGRRPLHPLYFWSSLTRVGECWEWGGERNAQGYGKGSVLGFGSEAAHRIAWMLANDAPSIPQRRMICHHCDNPSCCNPAHLYCGTAADNMYDQRRRNRRQKSHHRGSGRGRRLTRHTQNPPPLPIGEAARRLGVSVDTLRRWSAAGRIAPIVLPSGHRRYRVEDIDALTEQRSA